MPEFVHGHGVVFPDCDWEPGVDPVSAPRELVIDARDLAGDIGPGGGAVPRLGRGAAGRAADEEVGEAARAAGARAALLAHARARLGARVGGEGARPPPRGAGRLPRLPPPEPPRARPRRGGEWRPLAHHLRAVCASWEGLAGKVWAGSYHQLGAELCGRAGVAWNEPPNDLSEATRLF